jgi:hypothetical protein
LAVPTNDAALIIAASATEINFVMDTSGSRYKRVFNAPRSINYANPRMNPA